MAGCEGRAREDPRENLCCIDSWSVPSLPVHVTFVPGKRYTPGNPISLPTRGGSSPSETLWLLGICIVFYLNVSLSSIRT